MGVPGAGDDLVGIAIAVGLSVAELFGRIARAHDAVQGEVPGWQVCTMSMTTPRP